MSKGTYLIVRLGLIVTLGIWGFATCMNNKTGNQNETNTAVIKNEKKEVEIDNKVKENALKQWDSINLWRKSVGLDQLPPLPNENGTDVNMKDKNGQTMLDYATTYGIHGCMDIVKLLIYRGFDVHNNSTNALTETITTRGKTEVARLLIEKGANINSIATAGGMSMLSNAICAENTDIEMLLCDKGANVNLADNDGTTPLHHACMRGDLNMVKLLIEKGANVNARNNLGKTPLFDATFNGNLDVINLLINKGVNINATDNSNETVLDVAFFDNVKSLLSAHGAVKSSIVSNTPKDNPEPINQNNTYANRSQNDALSFTDDESVSLYLEGKTFHSGDNTARVSIDNFVWINGNQAYYNLSIRKISLNLAVVKGESLTNPDGTITIYVDCQKGCITNAGYEYCLK